MTDRNDISAKSLLNVLSAEIAEMSRLSEKIQTIVVLACANLPEAVSFHKDAQVCDLLTQKLSASAGFLSDIAKHVPDHWAIDVSEATRGITLAELALAYSLKRPPVRTESEGTLELFEAACSSK